MFVSFSFYIHHHYHIYNCRIYIDIDPVTSDGQIFYKKLQAGQFEMAGAAWIGDFNDAGTFLDLLQSASGNNYGRYNNPRYDALLDRANHTVSVTERGALLEARAVQR